MVNFCTLDICARFVERIIIFSLIWSHYYSRGCYLCDRFHETDQVEGVCSVANPEEDIRGIQLHGI